MEPKGLVMGIVKKLRGVLLGKRKDEARNFEKLKHLYSVNGKLMFVGDLLRRTTERTPLKSALIDENQSISYIQFYSRVVSFANLLLKKGVVPRDNVLLYCENSIDFYVAYFAVWQIRACVVPVNTFLHEKELAEIIQDADPKVIVTKGLEAKLNKIVEENHMEALPTVLNEESFLFRDSVAATVEEIDGGLVGDPLDSDELCLLLYTSGTTGVPKGVMLSSRNIMANFLQSASRLRGFAKGKERVLSVLPLFHVFAQNTCMWFPVFTGSSIIVVPRIERKHILAGLKRKPSVFFGFPALYGLLCLMKNAPLESIKLFISGADAMPDKIRAAFSMLYGRKICAGYGLTEASPVVAINHIDGECPSNYVGAPLYGIECEIRDESGQSVGFDKVGTLWIRGDNIMLGYYKSKDATDLILKDGWLNTGDLSTMDSMGNLIVQGRSKDLIIRNGINIYPQEVENVLMRHPEVFKVAVIGRDEAVSGQVPIAFVAVRSPEKGFEAKLRFLCASNLASYKIPRKFICMEDLPMNSTGKIDKKRLRGDF